MAGDDQATATGQLLGDPDSDGDAVETGHLEVEHGDVGAQGVSLGDGLRAGGGLADDLDVVLEIEHLGERHPDQVLVVGQQDADHAVTSLRRRARTGRGRRSGRPRCRRSTERRGWTAGRPGFGVRCRRRPG